MTRLGMVIDLKRCIGCYGCTMACKAENATPPGVFWNRVLVWEEGKYPVARQVYFPVQCNHCQDAPCKKVCPTGATSQRPDGIVLIDYNKCIGCRACVTACPYQNRYYQRETRTYYPGVLTPFEEVGYAKFPPKVVTKCNFCVHRVDQGLQPACVQTCISKARTFGDLDNPESEVSLVMRNRHVFRLRPELGTEPSVYYLG
ncbi:MAG: 4Fe-4S dicluster domain-containing protein [Chloroflexi bacterium]|nr:4Fe-4S dicluster domain-containing protein [Chloroflexota bacterium]